MKIKIATSGRSATLDIENEQIAEAVFNRLVIMMFGITKEYQEKRKITSAKKGLKIRIHYSRKRHKKKKDTKDFYT